MGLFITLTSRTATLLTTPSQNFSKEFNVVQVGLNFKALRLRCNLTQFYVAYKLNISQNVHSKCELGETKLSLRVIYELADISETAAEEFVRILIAEQY